MHVVGGFTNRSLRARVAALLGEPYTQAQTSYDLRRRRLKAIITRLPHTNTDHLTPDGLRVAVLYVKGHDPDSVWPEQYVPGSWQDLVRAADPPSPRDRSSSACRQPFLTQKETASNP